MITNAEKELRREAAEYAKASVGLEGITLSSALLDIVDEFINGYLSVEEFGAKYDLALEQGL